MTPPLRVNTRSSPILFDPHTSFRSRSASSPSPSPLFGTLLESFLIQVISNSGFSDETRKAREELTKWTLDLDGIDSNLQKKIRNIQQRCSSDYTSALQTDAEKALKDLNPQFRARILFSPATERSS